MAWISSTTNVRAVASIALPLAVVSRIASDSGVVTRMCGGALRICARSRLGVSDERTSTRTSGSDGSRVRNSVSGCCRFFCTSLASARSGET